MHSVRVSKSHYISHQNQNCRLGQGIMGNVVPKYLPTLTHCVTVLKIHTHTDCSDL